MLPHAPPPHDPQQPRKLNLVPGGVSGKRETKREAGCKPLHLSLTPSLPYDHSLTSLGVTWSYLGLPYLPRPCTSKKGPISTLPSIPGKVLSPPQDHTLSNHPCHVPIHTLTQTESALTSISSKAPSLEHRRVNNMRKTFTPHVTSLPQEAMHSINHSRRGLISNLPQIKTATHCLLSLAMPHAYRKKTIRKTHSLYPLSLASEIGLHTASSI